MTIIAWDGKILVADKQITAGTLKRTGSKLFRIPGAIGAISGEASYGLEMIEWIKNGEKKEELPTFQRTDQYCPVLLIRNGQIFLYERSHLPIFIEDDICAIGSGRDFALGAMASGKNALESAKIAARFDIYCGNGFDQMEP